MSVDSCGPEIKSACPFSGVTSSGRVSVEEGAGKRCSVCVSEDATLQRATTRESFNDELSRSPLHLPPLHLSLTVSEEATVQQQQDNSLSIQELSRDHLHLPPLDLSQRQCLKK